MELLRELESQITAERLFPVDARVVVGVSGGADSMGLLYGLVGLNETGRFRLDLHVAHLNHCLRGSDSQADVDLVRAAAERLHLPCGVESADVRGEAATRGVSVEEAARDVRYRFFGEVCDRTGAMHLAVGHHADDNVETVLHRILRGTGIRGLGGIPCSRALRQGSAVRLVRPMLGLRRRDILNFVAARGVSFREDATNADDTPMRNRLRNTLLPMLADQVNPQVDDALLRLAEQARWANDHLDLVAAAAFESLVLDREEDRLALDAVALAGHARIVQTELVRRAIAVLGVGERDLGFGHLCAVADLAAAQVGHRKLDLPGGLVVAKEYGSLVFAVGERVSGGIDTAERLLLVPGRTPLAENGLELVCELTDVAEGAIEVDCSTEEWVDYDAVRPPLTIRLRRDGDRFHPLGAPGSKRVAEFLIDAKVERAERARVKVVCDQAGPLWVVGHRIDQRVRLTETTRRVLKMRVDGGDS